MVYPQMQHIASQKRSYWSFNIFLKTHIKKNKAKEQKIDVKDHKEKATMFIRSVSRCQS